MIPIIIIENDRGEVLDFSTSTRYRAILTGTGPPAATINRSKVAMADGTRHNSGTVDERNLRLTVYLLRDVARARLNLYKYLGTNAHIKVYYQADGLDVYVEGYVETAEVNPWERQENLQASIICPDPYWKDVTETYTDASAVEALFEFPFAIDSDGVELARVDNAASTVIVNEGTAEAGAVYELQAVQIVTNPKVYNLTTGKFIGVDVELQPGDRLVISTVTDKKTVTHIRNGTRSNFINYVARGSAWPKLAIGANEYSYVTDSGECKLHIYHTNMYIGV